MDCAYPLESMGLSRLICLRSEIGRGRPRLGKVAGEERLKERAEDDLSTALMGSLVSSVSSERTK